LRGGKYRAKS